MTKALKFATDAGDMVLALTSREHKANTRRDHPIIVEGHVAISCSRRELMNCEGRQRRRNSDSSRGRRA